MQNIKGYLAIHLCTFLFGISAIIGEHVQVGITGIVFGRSFFGMLLLAILLYFFTKDSKKLSISEKLILTVNGILLGIHWLCFFMAIKVGGVALGTIGFASFPAFIVIIESMILRKPPTKSDALIVFTILIGMYILVPHSMDYEVI